jgi:hypothetical protein
MAIPDLSHNELAVGLQMGLEQLDAITAAIMDRNIFGRAQRRYLINGVKKFFITRLWPDGCSGVAPLFGLSCQVRAKLEREEKFLGKISRFLMPMRTRCSGTYPEAFKKFRGVSQFD